MDRYIEEELGKLPWPTDWDEAKKENPCAAVKRCWEFKRGWIWIDLTVADWSLDWTAEGEGYERCDGRPIR